MGFDSNREVTARAFVLPKVYGFSGNDYRTPVVVSVKQGQALTGRGDDSGDLAPVLAGVAHANGDDDRSFLGGLHSPEDGFKEEPKPYPVKIWYLVDVSSSMGESASHSSQQSKLELVQSQIRSLTDNLPDGIKHTIIPYNHDLKTIDDDLSTKDVARRMQRLGSSGSTNILKPFQQVQEMIRRHRDPSTRHLVVLVSDGQGLSEHEPVIKRLATGFQGLNAAVYSVGTGLGYNEKFMQEIVQQAQFGGAVHIPEDGPIKVFKTMLPAFVNELVSAPLYPTALFESRFFERVFSLNPSTREVSNNCQRSFDQGHGSFTPSVAGYQRQAYSLGLMPKATAAAEIWLDVKHAANGQRSWTEAVPIERLDDVILDPSERDLISRIPLEVLIREIALKRDPDLVQFVLDNQPDLDAATRERLQQFKANLEQAHVQGNEQDFRAMSAGASQTVGSYTVTGRHEAGETVGFRAADETVKKPVVDDEGSPNKPPRMNTYAEKLADAWDQMESADEQLPNRPTAAEFQLDSSSSTQNPVVSLDLVSGVAPSFNPDILDAQGRIMIGPQGVKIGSDRNPNNDVLIPYPQNSTVSRNHCRIYAENGQVWIEDLGSMNGTYINDTKIAKVQLKTGDQIKMGTNYFRIKCS